MGGTQESAIFWDYENCPAPTGWSGCQVVKRIRDLVQQFGPIKLFKAYLSIAEQSQVTKSTALRSELQASGVSLTDSPHNGRKDVADKMMIVDMLIYAMDNPAPATIIVISGDRDFAYAISTLRLRQYDIVLLTLSNAHVSLTSQASLCYEWSTEVLGINETGSDASGLRGDADGFRFPPLKMGSLLSPNTPNKAANVPLPRTSPRKQATSGASPSSLHQARGSFTQNDALTTDVGSGLRLFQSPGGFQPISRLNMNSSLQMEDATVDIFDHFYSQKVGLRPASTSPSDIGGRENQDPFLAASHCYPSPRTSSRHAPLPERPLSRPTPARSSLEAASPTPSRTSFRPISSSVTSEGEPTKGFIPINPSYSHSSGTPISFSEASCSSSQYSSALDEADSLGPPIELGPESNKLDPATFNPAHFQPLIELLQSYHARGISKPFRPSIAMELISANNAIYASLPSVKNFTDYAHLAAKAGIVDMGGEGGEGWITLKAEYLEAKLSA